LRHVGKTLPDASGSGSSEKKPADARSSIPPVASGFTSYAMPGTPYSRIINPMSIFNQKNHKMSSDEQTVAMS
jgi:hypothetical protein